MWLGASTVVPVDYDDVSDAVAHERAHPNRFLVAAPLLIVAGWLLPGRAYAAVAHRLERWVFGRRVS